MNKPIPQHHCYECGVKLKPIWKDTKSNPDTWFWLDCDRCQNYVCEKCSDYTETETVCISCLKTEEVKK